MEKSFFIQNRKKLVENLENNSLVILFSGNPPHKSADEDYEFLPNMNFYYNTGLKREKFILVVLKTNDKIVERIYIEKPNPQLEKWVGKKLRKDEVKSISGIEKVIYLEEFKSNLNSILNTKNIENVYLDLEKSNWDDDFKKSHLFARDLNEKYPQINIKNIYNKISDMRIIKSEEEIKNIKKAISITKEGIESLMKNSKPGLYEYQLEAFFDFSIKYNGAKDYAFKTIAASGKNATILHYEENDQILKESDLILFDLGSKWNYYSSDISRTFPINGKFSKRQREVYEAVLEAEIKTIEKVKPGITLKELNDYTKSILIEKAKKLNILKNDDEITKYYFHGVSHHMGLDTHDVGDRERKLEKGMVITVEPGLYIEDENIGIRIEDDVLVTEDGCINLSKDIIKTVDEIEEFMINR
ncbi:aminopeptidase P family protein [Senegalia massiliensis]|uniref:aminopeptidase P family protein n=1 Tax=Senegalia massiliensis TaxID=1720316 RepID=UPI001030916C|nr:aminopeptidase P family protein [Senegalia massiliensis]